MIEATSCGGVVIFRGKILLLYKNYRNKYEGWVLPKGTVEEGEQHNETALREVKEETGVSAQIIKYVGKSMFLSLRNGNSIGISPCSDRMKPHSSSIGSFAMLFRLLTLL